MLVGTGGLTLFPGTPLLEEAKMGEFDPLSEKEMLIELKTFVENLTCDCSFITHHTIAANLTGPNFLERKSRIVGVFFFMTTRKNDDFRILSGCRYVIMMMKYHLSLLTDGGLTHPIMVLT